MKKRVSPRAARQGSASDASERACRLRKRSGSRCYQRKEMKRTGTPSNAIELVVVDENGRQVERPDR